ncbi:putative ribosomal protein L1 [Rosa chinensis]|uniref:Putative ribosomal protein L1 n=1 Tax=Rosa chinensis TaxID=74649 RepID=A0A2P6QXW1_ROSCH|nr:ribosomal L1 domain-containing protein 1 [Rosa chinensis]PRQ39038.1 putative ribosomal protein L1 [Rosa chinensis]
MAATTAAPPPSKSTPTKLNPKTVRKAVNALLKWRNSQTQNPDDLLDSSDEFTYLVLTLKKIPPKGRVNAFKIPLPNPLLSEFTQFCLIYDDGPKSKLTKDQIDKRIKTHNLPITKTLKLSKLKSDYKSFEAKRKLMESYDAFLADKQIVPLLPRLLGKQFFKKKRMIPVPVDLQQKNWKEQVDRVIESAMLFLSTGTCSVVRVARTSMSAEQIVENVVAAVDGIVEIVPRNWGGVRSFHLKLLESLALPVYQAVPDETLLKIEGVKGSEKEVVKNEKVGKKKGRISEVRYMDRNVGEVLDEDELSDGVIVDKEKRKSEDAKLKKAKRSKNAAE